MRLMPTYFMVPVILSLAGCYYLGQNTYSDIAATPSSVWSSPEVLTMIMEAGNHNLRDDRTHIKAIVTPYYPQVVKAIGRRAQALHHWSEDDYRGYVNQLLRESSGLYIDWADPGEPVYDGRLHVLDSVGQIDSLLFLLSLSNIGSGTWDISQLERNLFLVNERDSRLAPFSVRGKKMNVLGGIDETLFVKFKFRAGENHFLDKSDRYFFLIRGLGTDIRIELTTETMK
jgi:hypothetical protein